MENNVVKSTSDGTRLEFNIGCYHLKSCSKHVRTILGYFARFWIWVQIFDPKILSSENWTQILSSEIWTQLFV